MIAQALISLRPMATWTIHGLDSYANIEWLDDTQIKPTEEEIAAEIARLEAAHAATQYRRDRVYPPIGDQLDMIFHAGLGGPKFQAAITAVKAQHPKPPPVS